jgi:hypothetical protein
MKQTAVDWLVEKYNYVLWLRNKDEKLAGQADKMMSHYLVEAKEMEKEQQREKLIGLLDWMNQVAKDNPMAFETDSEDIVDMYLEAYYTKNK